MAGDWIKIEKCTPTKPEVLEISNSLDLDPDKVLGSLIRIWSWFDDHTTDGCHASVTLMSLSNRVAMVEGFAEAMVKVGWMEQTDSGVSIPNFERHNGKSSKTRALAYKRQQRHRAKSNDSVTQLSRNCNDSVTTKMTLRDRDRVQSTEKEKFSLSNSLSLSSNATEPTAACGGESVCGESSDRSISEQPIPDPITPPVPPPPPTRLPPRDGTLAEHAAAARRGAAVAVWTQAQVDEIYAAHPRRSSPLVAKPAIRFALDELLGRDGMTPASAHAWLLARVITYAATAEGKAGKGTTSAARWFSDGKYDDDPATWDLAGQSFAASESAAQAAEMKRKRDAVRASIISEGIKR